MKSIILFTTFFTIFLVGCYTAPMVPVQPQYQVMTGPGGQQMVQYMDNGQSLMMDYILWSSLMNSGGYNSIRNYNTTHTVIHYNAGSYKNWNSSPYKGTGSSTGSGFGNKTSTNQSTGSGFKSPSTSTSSGSGFKSSNSSSSSRSTGSGFSRGRH